MISGIPVLHGGRRDEARRFMTLVDALYDAHVNLVASAEAPPERLYDGADWGFEFDRTVSRLMEMQSVEYIEGSRRR
jgi:cell division protein ZapE